MGELSTATEEGVSHSVLITSQGKGDRRHHWSPKRPEYLHARRYEKERFDCRGGSHPTTTAGRRYRAVSPVQRGCGERGVGAM